MTKPLLITIFITIALLALLAFWQQEVKRRFELATTQRQLAQTAALKQNVFPLLEQHSVVLYQGQPCRVLVYQRGTFADPQICPTRSSFDLSPDRLPFDTEAGQLHFEIEQALSQAGVKVGYFTATDPRAAEPIEGAEFFMGNPYPSYVYTGNPDSLLSATYPPEVSVKRLGTNWFWVDER